MSKRNVGLDCLKIIAMLMIVFINVIAREYGIIWFIVLYLIGSYIRLYGNT